jgi:hypothetical protein
VLRRYVERRVGAGGGVVGAEPHQSQLVGDGGARLGHERVGGAEHGDRSVQTHNTQEHKNQSKRILYEKKRRRAGDYCWKQHLNTTVPLVASTEQGHHGHVVLQGHVEAGGVAEGSRADALGHVVGGALVVVAVEGHEVLGSEDALGLHGEGVVVGVGVGVAGQVQRRRHRGEHAPHAPGAVLRVGAHRGEGVQEIELFTAALGPVSVALCDLVHVGRVHEVVGVGINLSDDKRVGNGSHLRKRRRRRQF